MAYPLILNAYRELKAYLGRQDAFVALHELAFRELVGNAKAHKISVEAFFSELTAKHGVHVNFPDANNIREGIGKIYVLMTLGAYERFLHEFDDERENLTGDKIFKEGSDLRDCLLVVSNATAGKNPIGFLSQLVEYYRLVRNAAAHPFASKQHGGELRSQLAKIQTTELRKFIERAYGETARPNQFDHMDFDDFILCSRISKDYALQVATLFSPELSVISEQLSWKQRFSHLTENTEKRRCKCNSDLRTKFGLDEHEADAILDCIGGF